MLIRNAINSYKEQLRVLFKECFGNMAENNGALSWIKGRYKVAEIDNKIVAVSGILPIEYSEYGDSVTNDCLTYTLEDVAFEKGLFQDYTCILLWSAENNGTEPKVTDRCDLYVNDTKADVNKLKGYKEFNGRKELKLNYVRPNETVQL